MIHFVCAVCGYRTREFRDFVDHLEALHPVLHPVKDKEGVQVLSMQLVFKQIHNLCLTRKEAARYLGISPVTLWRWIKTGKVPAYHIGREVLIEKAELERL